MRSIKLNNTLWNSIANALEDFVPVSVSGFVSSIDGQSVTVKNFRPGIGSECIIADSVLSEVISVNEKEAVLVPYQNPESIRIGDKVSVYSSYGKKLGTGLLGRVVNALGEEIDGQGSLVFDYKAPDSCIPKVLERPLITEQLYTGIKVIDSFVPIGKGQRIGIFSGNGVGKTTLMAMMLRNSSANVNVVCLVGERGREIKELLQGILGKEERRKAVVVNASPDEAPVMRVKAMNYAISIAEYFRDKGNDVAFYMDSVTRLAHAQREIGLMRGEVPASRGYPGSIYPLFSTLFERCSTATAGSITGIFTILVEGDDPDEPITDIVRGMLDGHIHLSRELAEKSHYPAVQVPVSLSRVAPAVQNTEISQLVKKIRKYLGEYEQSKDLVNAGVYTPGSNQVLDSFLNNLDRYNSFVQQNLEESVDFPELCNELRALAGNL